MASSLPSTRQLLTSILNTLSAPTPQQPSTIVNEPYSTPSNPLKNIPSSQRALLTTLHVLFPPPLLLQALDLLDRGLVLRVIENSPSSTVDPSEILREEEATGPSVYPPQANIHLAPSTPPAPGAGEAEAGKEKGKRNAVYRVRTSQPPKSRFRDSGGGMAGSNIYTVRLQAWNCSCAAFAFSAFPGGFGGSGKAAWKMGGEGDGVGGVGREGEREDWGFGGLSFDGREGGGKGVPVCKHLVACLLGERWGVLGGYIKEREVSREEMGGVSAEG
ncbi:hypothetical protein V8E51_006725 [Hyaloscypha variabilis]